MALTRVYLLCYVSHLCWQQLLNGGCPPDVTAMLCNHAGDVRQGGLSQQGLAYTKQNPTSNRCANMFSNNYLPTVPPHSTEDSHIHILVNGAIS